MTKQHLSKEDGFTLVYLAGALTFLTLCTGLAVDTGRAYVVKAQLTKAVDGAALGAARALNSGDPRGAAGRIFRANFPSGYLGTTSVTDSNSPGFFNSTVVPATGVNIVTVTATAVVPTTFMRVANLTSVTVSSTGEATRRMVDLSLILDVSSSIGSQWGAVHDATQAFINAFDQNNDRMSLLTFGNGAGVLDQMPSSRGFAKSTLVGHVPTTLPGGSTNMVEGLYRGWDELRSVPAGSQSGLRVIVLFTDGASNGVPGNWDGTGVAKSLRTYDFPKNFPDPDGQTWNNPTIGGLYDTQGATSGASPSVSLQIPTWNATTTIATLPFMPPTSLHTHHRSSGIPTSYPLQTAAINVNGMPQSARRGLRNGTPGGQFPADVWNINNAARNLLEIIANDARNDNGDYKIRIYTIGMGDLVQYNLGTMPEKPSDILKRIANDPESPDHNANQLDGKFFWAKTAADVSTAFQGIQNQILRLSK
ncbi:MAG: VWA domain-containing protein [Vicinamibacterales bacterium]